MKEREKQGHVVDSRSFSNKKNGFQGNRNNLIQNNMIVLTKYGCTTFFL